jgi:hypothetical protein
VIVQDERGALGEVPVVRNGRAKMARGDRHLRPPAELAEGSHSVAGTDAGVSGRAAYDTADLHAGHEGEVRLDLVFPAGLE